jgi:esterase/lipase superfamily enzyme
MLGRPQHLTSVGRDSIAFSKTSSASALRIAFTAGFILSTIAGESGKSHEPESSLRKMSPSRRLLIDFARGSRAWRKSWPLLAFLWCLGCAAPAGPRHAATVPVYYATTRAIVENAKSPDASFGAQASDPQVASYGRAMVEIAPPKVRIAAYDPPLASHPGLSPGDFFRAVRNEMAGAHPLIVYVHGFNNTFATAAHRAAIFSQELQPDVAERPAIYSWASASKVLAYSRDEETALLNQDNIRRFLDKLHDKDETTPVVLIGHSLGARAVTYALRDIALIRGSQIDPKRPMFAHLILLEPDVNRLYFRQNIVRARGLCGHVTIYASSRDRALGVSRFLHNYQRLGEVSDNLAGKIDVIDASAVRSDLFGHSYDRPVLFEDIRALLRGKNMSERENHTLEKGQAEGVYRLLPAPRT